jgi:hypothetical protein
MLGATGGHSQYRFKKGEEEEFGHFVHFLVATLEGKKSDNF